MRYIVTVVMFLFVIEVISAQEIDLRGRNAEVWGTSQLIEGKMSGFLPAGGVLKLNENQIFFDVDQQDSSFSVPIELGEGINFIIVTADNGLTTFFSDTLMLNLAYNIKPDIFSYAVISGFEVTLKAEVLENPGNEILSFNWTADIDNPAPVTIANPLDSTASVSFSMDAPSGEYYFDLLVINTSGDSARARTYVTVKENGIVPFDIHSDHAAWIESAVIYEITPYLFTAQGNFNRITEKIPDLVRLGINTIWLQPVYSTYYGGQGYDVINYFRVREDLGTEEDLRNLVAAAKSAGLKVLFDFVANHSSIKHRYAQETIQYGEDSHYWDYYQREVDNAPYSQHYKFHRGFINYFWDDLPNLNYSNPEVHKWITEAAKYWIEKFDIDGYRFDAVWGVTARNPMFTKNLRLALKRIKPEIMMLGEDKASQPQAFDERFDVAYDWAPGYGWVSQWMWATDYNPNANPTIFNSSNPNQRASLLRNAITNYGNGHAPRSKVLRFIDNNDQYYFITHHQVERTKMAAALLLTLHGIPLIYNGQEIGKSGHPYTTSSIFQQNQPIDYNDPNNLFPYYQRLLKYRQTLPALYSDNYDEIPVSPGNFTFGFRRWEGDQNVFTILNMSGNAESVKVKLPVQDVELDPVKTYYLNDLITGRIFSGIPSELKNIEINMDAFSASVFLLADSAIYVSAVDDEIVESMPDQFYINQNYPNPFNPNTIISFNIPEEGNTEVIVYDVLGSRVATLLNEVTPAGVHNVEFDGSELSSGIYFYRINYQDQSFVRKMMLVK